VGILMTCLVGAIGLFSAGRLAYAIDNSTNMDLAMQSSQEADMLHGAVRSDVMMAMLSAISGNSSQLHVLQSKVQILSILAAALLLVIASLWLARRLAEPMTHAVNMANQLAQGNLAVPVVIRGNDETIQLLTAMSRMQASFGGIVKNVKINAESVAIKGGEVVGLSLKQIAAKPQASGHDDWQTF
jgi:methyl-accepting chemotaxis protein